MAEVQDQKIEIEKKCLEHHCGAEIAEYNACLERIKTVPLEKEPHCFPAYFAIVHCVDHCTDPILWKLIK